MSVEATVVPVVDYEPPISGSRRPADPVMVQRRAHRLAVVPPPRRQTSATAAAMFADTALRGVLEVVDGRRSFAQLQPLLGKGIADTILTLARSSGTGTGFAAQLRRVSLRIVDRDGDAAEVFATYMRDDRVRAIAARVERTEVRGRRRWRLVALHVG